MLVLNLRLSFSTIVDGQNVKTTQSTASSREFIAFTTVMGAIRYFSNVKLLPTTTTTVGSFFASFAWVAGVSTTYGRPNWGAIIVAILYRPNVTLEKETKKFLISYI